MRLSSSGELNSALSDCGFPSALDGNVGREKHESATTQKTGSKYTKKQGYSVQEKYLERHINEQANIPTLSAK
jgi:hypothetical protein